MKIQDAIDDFINYCVFEKGLSDKTKESYTYDLKMYKEYLYSINIEKADKISEENIINFLKYRTDIDDSTSTIAHNLTVIKNFHAYLVNQIF